jgi:hypothetical protein
MKILRPVFEILCMPVLIVSHINLSYDYYGGWWLSGAGLLLILLLGLLAWKKEFISMSGLNIPFREIPKILLTAAGITALSFACLYWMGSEAGITMSLNCAKSYIHNVFYILNEEIILGALVLYFLNKKIGIPPLLSSLILAIVVAFAHWILYKWYFRDKGFLAITTLLTLFLVAFFKNNLILRFSHIGYAWAFHLGWMAVMFGTIHYYNSDWRMVTDLEKFNLYLGSNFMLVFSFLLAIASIFMFKKEKAIKLSPLRSWRKPQE